MIFLKEQFRNKVHSGLPLFSTMLSFSQNPRWILILKSLGFDFVTIDMEHSPFSWSEVSNLVNMAVGAQLSPIVRVPRPRWHYVTKVFDIGAFGVLAPYCETVEEVKEVVRAARWRPLKGYLVERVMNENIFPGIATKSHLQQENGNNIVMIGIESVPALQNLENILMIKGIDAIFVGPADLSISLGVPRQFEHPKFVNALKHIITVAIKHQVQVAVNFQSIKESIRWAKKGINLIIHSQDFKVFSDAYAEILTHLASETGRAVKGEQRPQVEI